MQISTQALLTVYVIWCMMGMVAGTATGAWAMRCPTEDSVHCVWYGPIQGNGDGSIVINW